MNTLLTPRDVALLNSKPVEFLMARYPRYLSGALAALFAFSIYGLEKRILGRVHPQWTRKLGFSGLFANSAEAQSVAELIEMIMGSSTVPPVMPGNGYRGESVLDGGVVDNVPAFLADGREGETLVLLSKRYGTALPEVDQRIYVQPSETIGLDKFDYSNPAGLAENF